MLLFEQQTNANKSNKKGKKTNNCNQQTNKPDVNKIAFESLQLLFEQQTDAKKSNSKKGKNDLRNSGGTLRQKFNLIDF